MRRLLGLAGAVVLGLGLLAPVALAAAPLGHTDRVLLSTEGVLVVPAGDHADVVVVLKGNADVRGEVNTLVIVEGTATLTGAKLETVVAVSSQVEVQSGTIVYGEIQRLDAVVHQSGTGVVQGGIVDLRSEWFELGGALAAALALLWVGFGVATVVAGLLLAAIAGRQVRSAHQLISREPLLAGVAGLVGVIFIPVVAILLFPTVIGAPLGFGILVVALPLVAFAGYLVMAAWTGTALLGLFGPQQERERPFLPMVVGVLVLGLIGLIPPLNLLVALASLLGFGAVLVLTLRTIVGGQRPVAGATQPLPMATGA
jgi:hypothetical protein